MADSTPRHYLDLEDLAVHEGAAILLRRVLARLGTGEWFEVRGDSPDLAEQLPAWCRQQGHRCEAKQGVPRLYRIESGGLSPAVVTSGSEVSEVAEPIWGLAPRGARIETGGPNFGFTLRQKRDVWAYELNAIYTQATANQWSASRDVPWSELPKLST